MSILSTAIGKRVRDLGLKQKEVAVAFHGAIRKLEKKGQDVDFKTVPPKLSKLLTGSREGESFFFASDARATALAEALKWTVAQLRALRDSSHVHRVLVLHPGLPEEPREFFKRQAARSGGSFSCVEVSVGDGDATATREALRRACEENLGCLLVMNDDTDADYWEGAKIAVTRFEQRPRGWSLEAAPTLVPQPPPDPPPTTDPQDGMPMANPPGFLAALETEIQQHANPSVHHRCILGDPKAFEAVRAALAAARRIEGEPTFRIDHLFDWIGRDVLPEARLRVVDVMPPTFHEQHHWGPRREPATADVVFAAVSGAFEGTLVWTHRGRVFAVGPHQQPLSRAFHLPGHPVVMPTTIARLRTHIARGNPWRADQTTWKRLCSEVQEECGLNVDAAHAHWLEATDAETRDARASNASSGNREGKLPRAWTIRHDNETNINKARAQLKKLLRREFNLPRDRLDLLFVLEAISAAPLIALPVEGHDAAHAIANIGAGNVARIRVMTFSGEQAEALHLVESKTTWATRYWAELDGGDIHVWLESWHLGLLDGQSLSRVLQRREETRRRQDIDDDDD